MSASFRFNSNSNAQSNSQGNNDAWKAQAFINLYLPGAEGKNTKLHAIPLKAANPDEKFILDWAKAGDKRECVQIQIDEATGAEVEVKVEMTCLEWILDNLVIDFREVRTEGTKFAMPQPKAK